MMLLGGLMTSCSDDSVAESWVYNFADVETTAGGSSTLYLDSGDTLRVSQSSTFEFETDTVVRYIVGYVVDERGEARVSSGARVLTGSPIAADGELRAEEVGVESVWIGGHYLNLRLSVWNTGGSHTFGFVKIEDGDEGLSLLLYHDADSLEGVYHYTTYLSCNLESAAERGDSVRIAINEEDEGWQTYGFCY